MEHIHSLRSTERAYVRFINETDRSVDVVWINFTGTYIKHNLGEKGNFIDVNTYKGHPWIVFDSRTNDRLHIDKQYIYYPKTAREYFAEKYPHKQLPFIFDARIRARITLPVYSLKHRALLEIRNLLTNTDQVDDLDLPRELKDSLKRELAIRDK